MSGDPPKGIYSSLKQVSESGSSFLAAYEALQSVRMLVSSVTRALRTTSFADCTVVGASAASMVAMMD